MTVVEAEAELLASAGPAARPARPERPARERRSWFGWLSRPAVALACALVLLVGGGVIGGLLAGGGEETRTVSAQTAPEGATVDLKIARRGRDAWSRPACRRRPSGRVYQVWAQRRAGSRSPTTALWSPRADGSADVAVPGLARRGRGRARHGRAAGRLAGADDHPGHRRADQLDLTHRSGC